MCGIAGVVTWDERYRITRATLQAMSARIAHRGPDGEGILLTRENGPITPDTPQVGFAFRRLAILDPDPRSMQPFTIGHQTLVFNGEIYNFRELRAELTKLRPDYPWRTTGDTEVLLMSYAVWGEKCVEHLNGMFAFAVWDERVQMLFLARDRMGQKPLYVAYLDTNAGSAPHLNYHWSLKPPAVVAFSSELFPLLQLSWVDRAVNHDAIADYLSWGYVMPTNTAFVGARTMPQGQWMKIEKRGAGLEQYFQPCGDPPQSRPDADVAQSTRRLLTEAVRRQLVADVPLGCFLSGGMDSSVVTAAMKSAGGDVETFSIGFEDARYDESRYAAEVAQHLKTRHHEFHVRPDAAADLPKLAAVFGEPFGDSSALPTHYLSRETRKHVKVALSGDGGDELFGGYDRYRAMRLDRVLRRIPRRLRAAIPVSVLEELPGSHPKSVAARARRFLSSANLEAHERYEAYVRLFSEEQIQQLWLAPMREHHPIADLMSIAWRRDPVEAALAVDRMTYLPNDLLTKVDRACMLHGLEVRSPFMDHELVQFAAGLTTDQLLKGGPKRMLREAFKDDLPAWVFKRKKMGFAVPIGEWFRTDPPLRAMLNDCLFARDAFGATHFNMVVVRRLVDEHMSERVDHSQRLYALLMLELWWRTRKG
jgi:asparagine synthase (glutamine-hydrolysing)